MPFKINDEWMIKRTPGFCQHCEKKGMILRVEDKTMFMELCDECFVGALYQYA